ncbi:hypothetical protein [Tenggerimyces flavus]|uniref:Uncharacterized protein n=1 Tax=Tenggerimyces flavus TaxID=1708749 RepID=A0ABV7YHE7_9ACTN|nr:hypothetical protein [Tenggerimyces flavus]MBM7786102.1 hypothetical protein [Tenggerimyces flavus]
MHLIQEDLARAQIRGRLETAEESRRAAQLLRARRFKRRASQAVHQARLAVARLV